MKKIYAMATAVLLMQAGTLASPISDELDVYNAGGFLTYRISATEATEGAELYHFLDVPGLADPSMANSRTGLWELIQNPASIYGWSRVLSDVFGVALGPSGYPCLFFVSASSETELDFDDRVTAADGPWETSSPVDATMYLAEGLRNAGWTATFISDADVPDGGATAGLLGLGMLAFGWLRRSIR